MSKTIEQTQNEALQLLISFRQDSVDKYVEGQQEHGGNIEDRNLNHEIRHEVMDLMFYVETQKKQKELLIRYLYSARDADNLDNLQTALDKAIEITLKL